MIYKIIYILYISIHYIVEYIIPYNSIGSWLASWRSTKASIGSSEADSIRTKSNCFNWCCASQAPESKKHSELAHDMRDALNAWHWVDCSGCGRRIIAGYQSLTCAHSLSVSCRWHDPFIFNDIRKVVNKFCDIKIFHFRAEVVHQNLARSWPLWCDRVQNPSWFHSWRSPIVAALQIDPFSSQCLYCSSTCTTTDRNVPSEWCVTTCHYTFLPQTIHSTQRSTSGVKCEVHG